MDITLREITVRELTDGYRDAEDSDVFGYGGKLDIRPPWCLRRTICIVACAVLLAGGCGSPDEPGPQETPAPVDQPPVTTGEPATTTTADLPTSSAPAPTPTELAGCADEPQDVSGVLAEVPDLFRLSHGDAVYLLRSVGLEPDPSYQVNTEAPENTVFAQKPPPGQRIECGGTVELTVSQEVPRVPPVRGRARVDATEILRTARYDVIVIEGPSQAAAGIVVWQEPSSNTELAPGEAVTITVSTGPGQIFVPDVPDVRGQTLSQAFQTLIGEGFRVGERREASSIVEEGQIIDTDPPQGFPVSAGLEVFVIISSGPPLVEIPDVKGLLFDTGRLAIERAGLTIDKVTFEPVEPGSSDVGRILAQTPPPNLEVSAETPVDVVVGESSDLSSGQTPSHRGVGSDVWVEIPDLSDDRPPLDSVEIPDLVGRYWDPLRVAAELRELTLGVVAVGVQADEYAQGTIIAQAPAAGSLQRGGIIVTVEVAGLPG